MPESKIEIDDRKVQLLLKKVIILETTNLKTKKYNNNEMVKKIKSLIEEEVECY